MISNDYLIQDIDTGLFTAYKANTDGTYSPVSIQIGVQGPKFTEIISGLSEGDSVALPSEVLPAEQGK
jgi:hypothetical protein